MISPIVQYESHTRNMNIRPVDRSVPTTVFISKAQIFEASFRENGSRFTAVNAEGLWLDNSVFPVVDAADVLRYRPRHVTKTSRFLFPLWVFHSFVIIFKLHTPTAAGLVRRSPFPGRFVTGYRINKDKQ